MLFIGCHIIAPNMLLCCIVVANILAKSFRINKRTYKGKKKTACCQVRSQRDATGQGGFPTTPKLEKDVKVPRINSITAHQPYRADITYTNGQFSTHITYSHSIQHI